MPWWAGAQPNTSPSPHQLWQLLDQPITDSMKVLVYAELAWQYKENRLDSAGYYLEEALGLALQLKSPVLISRIYFIKGHYSLKIYRKDSSLAHFEKARYYYRKIKKKPNPSWVKKVIAFPVFNALAQVNAQEGNIKKALAYRDSMIALIDTSDYQEQIALESSLASLFIITNQLDQAKEKEHKLISISKKFRDDIELSTAFYNMAFIFWIENKYDSCRYYLEKGIQLAQKINRKVLENEFNAILGSS